MSNNVDIEDAMPYLVSSNKEDKDVAYISGENGHRMVL